MATGDVGAVQRWLSRLGLTDYGSPFQQHMVDGKTLCSLSEADLERDFGGVVRGRRRLLLEIDAVRAAAPPVPPPPVRRMPSEPARGYTLADDLEPLELQHVCSHVARSQLGVGPTSTDELGRQRVETLEVVRVQRVVNTYLDYMLDKTARGLCAPGAHRAMPPQGGVLSWH